MRFWSLINIVFVIKVGFFNIVIKFLIIVNFCVFREEVVFSE